MTESANERERAREHAATATDAWREVLRLAEAIVARVDAVTAETGIGPMDHDAHRIAGIARRMLEREPSNADADADASNGECRACRLGICGG